MIYTPLTIRAMQIAYSAHLGQVDKAGVPYIFHPLHLAEQMEEEISCCAALLHDTVEDTSVTLDDLAAEFPAEVVEAVRLLTHDSDPQQSHRAYGKAGRSAAQFRRHPFCRCRGS